MHLLIVGAGYIGSALVAGARQRFGADVEISALRRNVAALPAGVRPLPLDLADPQPWPRLALPPVDSVVFCAAPDVGDAEGYEAIYVRGTARVLTALGAEGHCPTDGVFVSSTGVYGQNDGAHVHEASPTAPERYQGTTMLRAEATVQASPWPTCVLRCGGIYGPERVGIVRRLREGRMPWPRGVHYTNRIHRDDCVGAIIHVLGRRERAPIYNVVDDLAAPQSDVLRFVAQRLGLPLPALASSEPETPPGAVTGKRVSNALLRQHGYACRYPTYETGYDAIFAAEGAAP